jgi:hypothetical protein
MQSQHPSVVWGISDISLGGRALLECVGSADLEMLNNVQEPIFLTERRQEIINITLYFRELVSEIHGCRVSPEHTLSVQRRILFDLEGQKGEKVNYRNPQITCCASYWEKLRAKLRGVPGHFGTVEDTETHSFCSKSFSLHMNVPASDGQQVHSSGGSAGKPGNDRKTQEDRSAF